MAKRDADGRDSPGIQSEPSSFPVPTGIQQLLRMAALHSAFLDQLIAKRGEVADAAGVRLTPSERAILAKIPPEHLTTMVATLPPPQEARRDFLRQTAASAVVLLGGAVLSESASGCSPSPTEQPPAVPTADPQYAQPPDDPGRAPPTEVTPEPVPPEPVPPRPETTIPSNGILPDQPPAKRPHDDTRTRGIRPDSPPER